MRDRGAADSSGSAAVPMNSYQLCSRHDLIVMLEASREECRHLRELLCPHERAPVALGLSPKQTVKSPRKGKQTGEAKTDTSTVN